jgi:orotidine 5'-phosphate decarboxylase subfamily 2
MVTFFEMLELQASQGKHLCVGLDPDYKKMPARYKIHTDCRVGQLRAINDHMMDVVRSTKHVAACYKPNAAFYERYGWRGVQLLEELIAFIHEIAPGVPVILDWKRSDIGNTNECLAEAAFVALTLHPYLGGDANEPFLRWADKGFFVLCKTSNPNSDEFQDIKGGTPQNSRWLYRGHMEDNVVRHRSWEDFPLYLHVAWHVSDTEEVWSHNGNCGLVAGATHPDQLAEIRQIARDAWLLVPGVGPQGGDLEASVRAAGYKCFLINVSSGISFADDFQAAAEGYHQQILDVMSKGR